MKHLSNVAQEIAMTARGVTLQEALERGAQEQWSADMSWTLDLMTVAESGCPFHWDDLTGEPPDTKKSVGGARAG